MLRGLLGPKIASGAGHVQGVGSGHDTKFQKVFGESIGVIYAQLNYVILDLHFG